MNFLLILSTLRRHRTAAALIVLQIALTCAIVANALFLIGERLERMNRSSGIVEPEIVRVQLNGIGEDANPEVLTREDLALLGAIPGVKAAATSSQLPFGNSSWNSGVTLAPGQTHSTLNVSTYFGEGLIAAFGLRLIAGRDFNREEYADWKAVRAEGSKVKPPAAILTRETAERLFPGKSGIGEVFYFGGDDPIRIVGIVDRLSRPGRQGRGGESGYAMLLPVRLPYTVAGQYVLRALPDRRAEVLTAAVKVLEKNNPNRIIISQDTFHDIRRRYFRGDRAVAWMLVGVSVALLLVTALGIVGLASFWVQQRTRQIGIRRALGATRGQILRYFQTENFVLATLGILLGIALAYGINYWLMERFETTRLPIAFAPVGALALWSLGQLAVLGPALRAAQVPPAVATRSV